jgi:hypothetical protein
MPLKGEQRIRRAKRAKRLFDDDVRSVIREVKGEGGAGAGLSSAVLREHETGGEGKRGEEGAEERGDYSVFWRVISSRRACCVAIALIL